MEIKTIFNAALFNSTSHNRLVLINQFLNTMSETPTQLESQARLVGQQQIDQLSAQGSSDKNTLAVLAVVITLPPSVLACNEQETVDERQPVAQQKNLRAKRLNKLSNAIATVNKTELLVSGLITIEPQEEVTETPEADTTAE